MFYVGFIFILFLFQVRPLVLLLGGLVKVQDSIECWEVRLRCIVRLWVWCCPYLSNLLGGILPGESDDTAGPPPISLPPSAAQDSHALQQVALPCIQYLHHLMQPSIPTSKVLLLLLYFLNILCGRFVYMYVYF